MNKYVAKQVAKKMLLTGALLWLLTTIASFVILWNVYGQAGSSFTVDNPTTNVTNGLTVWSVLAKINFYIQIGAYVILGLGVINLIISDYKHKHL
jgi:hypothetical protein